MINKLDFKSSALVFLDEYNLFINANKENNASGFTGERQILLKQIEFCHILKNLSHFYHIASVEILSGEIENALSNVIINNHMILKHRETISYALTYLYKLISEINEKSEIDIIPTIIPGIMNRLKKINTMGDNIPGPVEKIYHNEYKIIIKPSEKVFSGGLDLIAILDELNKLGSAEVIPILDNVPDLDVIDPEKCYIGWDIQLESNADINAVKDILLFLEYDKEGYLSIQTIRSTGDEAQKDLELKLDIEKDISNVKPGTVSGINSAPKDESLSTIRVAASRLDKIVDLAGEMVTVQSKMASISVQINNGELSSVNEELERLTDELREQSMVLRMLPASVLFRRFNRLVHDLAGELNKKIELSFEGEETELDKSVLEKLQDPMMHLIRNSIDHGIENSGIRIKAGKTEAGHIILSAFQSGQEIIVQIRDDGAGINFEKVRLKGIEKGLIKDSDNLNEKQLLNLIFTPGFSTAENVSNISGRGVGMDVVKSSIESLRGSIDINTSTGSGTTVTLKIPLTLAIIDGFMVEIGDGLFIIPLTYVEECINFNEELIENKNSRKIINIRGEAVPFIMMPEFFEISDKKSVNKMVIVRNGNDGKVGLAVNRLIGQHQTVIKPLGSLYKDRSEISGATILGDGTVALILDPVKIINSTLEEKI